MKTGLILYRIAVPAALLATVWLHDTSLVDTVVESALLGGKSWAMASADLPHLGN